MVPESVVDSPEYWRNRAEEARTLAEQMRDPQTKALMLGVAESYEKIAKWAAGSAHEPSSNAQ
jgi:DNA-binding ferritin-like protein